MKPSRRKIVTRAPGRTVYTLNLPGILPHPVEAESTLEVDAVNSLALYPRTTSIQHQPFVVPVTERGYTPDFLVTTSHGHTVVEVKVSREVLQYRETFDLAKDYLAEKGIAFALLTEKSLRQGKRHLRANELTRYAKAFWPDDLLRRTTKILSAAPNGLSVGELVDEASVPKELILYLIATRRASTGADLYTSDDSFVFSADRYMEANYANNISDWSNAASW